MASQDSVIDQTIHNIRRNRKYNFIIFNLNNKGLIDDNMKMYVCVSVYVCVYIGREQIKEEQNSGLNCILSSLLSLESCSVSCLANVSYQMEHSVSSGREL